MNVKNLSKTPPRCCCRICMDSLNNIKKQVNIFGSSSNYADMLSSIADVKLSLNDGLPNKICASCCTSLESAYRLKQTAESSDKMLHDTLQDASVKKKLSFNSITDIKGKLNDLINKKEKSSNVPIEILSNIVLEKEKTKTPTVVISDNEIISDDDDHGADDNKDSDYFPSDDERPLAQIKANKVKATDPVTKKLLSFKNLNIKKVQPRLQKTDKIELNVKENIKYKHVSFEQIQKELHDRMSRVVNKISKKNAAPKPEKVHMVCPICGIQTFTLDNHMMRVHKEKRFQCQICLQPFYTESSLSVHHRRRHTNKHQFVCSECSRGFFNQMLLNEHIHFKHRKVKVYTCDLCNKSFSHKKSIKYHLDGHEGIKRHVCHLCGVAFRGTHHLKSHMLTHTKERPYKCLLCNRDFIYKVNLNHHVLDHHNINIKGMSIKTFSTETYDLEMQRLQKEKINE